MTLNEQAPAARAEKTAPTDGHWYGHEQGRGWFPLYTPEKNYGMREARKLVETGGIAVPSVTGYLGELRKRSVEDWKCKNAARYGRDIKQDDYATEEAWLDVILGRVGNASKGAMDLGTRIHNALENAVGGKDYDSEMDVYVQPVLAERAKFGLKSIAQEKCVGSLKYGYAGKTDDLCEGMIVSDYKSRGEAKAYPTDWCQVAAYGFAEWGNEFFRRGAGIAFPISTKRPGVVKPAMKTATELVPFFECFLGLTGVWRCFHNFDPRKTQ